MKILVVDDEPDIRFLFEQKFRREIRSGTVAFEFAFSANAALARLAVEDGPPPDLVLSDINMPEMSGLELLQIIKQRYPHLRVVMVTAYSDEKNVAEALAAGSDQYLTKPINFAELRDLLCL